MELIMAMSLFLIVVSLATGAFLEALKTQRSIVSLTSSSSNVTQALEQVGREIRTGSHFEQSTDTTLNFTNYLNERVGYTLFTSGDNEGTIGRCSGFFCLQANPVYVPITSNKVKITSLKFHYPGNDPATLPPRITVTVSFTSAGSDISELNLQTTVSPYDIGT